MHIYTQDNKEYPSVTTIIHEVASNEALMKWANRMGFIGKDIEIIQRVSASFGTKVHSHLRKIVDPSAPDPIPAHDVLEQREIDRRLFLFNDAFKNTNYTTIATEKTIISPELGYAGTLDWLADVHQIDGITVRTLFDFKSAKTAHQTMFLQLGGYYNLLKSIEISVDSGVIVTLGDDKCKRHGISLEDLIFFGNCFDKLFLFYCAWMEAKARKPFVS